MEDRSKSSRLLLGMQSTLTAENLALLGRRHNYGKDPNAANWLSSRQQTDRSNHTLLAMELRQDGEREFLQMSVRGLYKYVIEVITTPSKVPNIASVTSAGGNVTEEPGDSSKEGEGDDAQKENESSDGDSQSHEEITYRDRLGGYLHPRDLRRLTSPFSASNEPELMVRRHVILCNFDPLRAIIMRDRLVVVVPEGADSMLADLERRVRGGIEEYENSVFGDVEEDTGSIHRYKKKPSGPLGVKLVSKAVKKSANAVKKAIGRNSRHNTVAIPPPPVSVPPKSSIPKETPENSTSTSTLPVEDENEFAELGSDEFDDLKGDEWKEMPFELKCADAVLHVVTNGLYEETYDIQQSALGCIRNIVQNQNGLSDEPLVDLRHITDCISEMESRVNRYMTSISRVLDDDEDLALMNLTRVVLYPERFLQTTSEEVLETEASEPSFIIEAHLNTAYTLQNVLRLINGQVDSASELVDRKQDAARNKILLANTIISVFSLCVGSASLVGSFFGMNLTNHLETHGSAWTIVLVSTMAMSVVIGILGLGLLIWSGSLPSMAVLFRPT